MSYPFRSLPLVHSKEVQFINLHFIYLVFKKSDQTTTKVRSIVSGQQLIRQDFDSNSISLNKNDEQIID